MNSIAQRGKNWANAREHTSRTRKSPAYTRAMLAGAEKAATNSSVEGGLRRLHAIEQSRQAHAIAVTRSASADEATGKYATTSNGARCGGSDGGFIAGSASMGPCVVQ